MTCLQAAKSAKRLFYKAANEKHELEVVSDPVPGVRLILTFSNTVGCLTI